MDVSDEILIQNFLRGDRSAFEKLVKKYSQPSFKLAFSVVKIEADAEEVVQDAFMKVFRSLSKFEGKSKFSSWLYRIVMNTALSKIRKTKPILVEVSDKTPAYDYTQPIEMNEKQYWLSQIFEQINDEDRMLLTLFHLEEMSMKDMENITGIGTNNLKIKLFRARKKFAEKAKQVMTNEVDVLHQ